MSLTENEVELLLDLIDEEEATEELAEKLFEAVHQGASLAKEESRLLGVVSRAGRKIRPTMLAVLAHHSLVAGKWLVPDVSELTAKEIDGVMRGLLLCEKMGDPGPKVWQWLADYESSKHSNDDEMIELFERIAARQWDLSPHFDRFFAMLGNPPIGKGRFKREPAKTAGRILSLALGHEPSRPMLLERLQAATTPPSSQEAQIALACLIADAGRRNAWDEADKLMTKRTFAMALEGIGNALYQMSEADRKSIGIGAVPLLSRLLAEGSVAVRKQALEVLRDMSYWKHIDVRGAIPEIARALDEEKLQPAAANLIGSMALQKKESVLRFKPKLEELAESPKSSIRKEARGALNDFQVSRKSSRSID